MTIWQFIILKHIPTILITATCLCDLVSIDVDHIPHDFTDNVGPHMWWSLISTVIMYPKQSKTKQNSENIYWLHFDRFYIDIKQGKMKRIYTVMIFFIHCIYNEIIFFSFSSIPWHMHVRHHITGITFISHKFYQYMVLIMLSYQIYNNPKRVHRVLAVMCVHKNISSKHSPVFDTNAITIDFLYVHRLVNQAWYWQPCVEDLSSTEAFIFISVISIYPASNIKKHKWSNLEEYRQVIQHKRQLWNIAWTKQNTPKLGAYFMAFCILHKEANLCYLLLKHGDVKIRKYFIHCWSSVSRILLSLVDSFMKGQLCGALMFSVLSAWTSCWWNSCQWRETSWHWCDFTVML